MEKVRNVDTAIKKIEDAAYNASKSQAQKLELKLKREGLASQLSQGIHGDGDSSKLASKLAPIQTEILILEAREKQSEKDVAAAQQVFLSVCHREADFVQRAGQEFVAREIAARYPKIAALFYEWGIPAEVYKGFPVATACNGDSLQWHRDMIAELGDLVNRSAAGREIDANQAIRALERCRCWFPEAAAAEEVTESK